FFFQAEDGIRYGHVTGVQTCALPISSTSPDPTPSPTPNPSPTPSPTPLPPLPEPTQPITSGPFTEKQIRRAVERVAFIENAGVRSEERRVGKEGRCLRAPDH